MSKELDFAEELIEFIYDSPTAFHTVDSVKKMLSGCGFTELDEHENWKIKNEGKYYVIRNHSALAAFVVGNGHIDRAGFRIIGAHTDSPSFRIKPSAEIISENHYVKLDTEPYGSPIFNTWMDRPLSVAGRVVLKSDDLFTPKCALVNIKRPILIIPNLAIHINKQVNSGVELNGQKDTLPLLAIINENLEKDHCLINAIAHELNVQPSDIIDFDLFLYEFAKGSAAGLNNEFISAPRLDDLSMVHAGITALTNSRISEAVNVMVCFDNEEISSSTKQGADSQFLSNVLERITLSLGGKNREDFFRAMSRSFMISADSAQAVHPNAGEKYDPKCRPLINKGPVIKVSAGLNKYTTDSDSSAVYASICKKAGIPYQWFANRSDERGGGTIGPLSSTHLDIRSVDIGTPLLAMHSIRELGGVLDHTYVTDSFKEFYSL